MTAKDGFTLIEVLVALAISAVAIAGVMILVGQYHINSAHLEKKLAADLAARNLMDRHRTLTARGSFFPLGPEDGEVTMGGFSFPYSQRLAPTSLEGMGRVDITIYDEDGQTALRRLSMYAVSPKKE